MTGKHATAGETWRLESQSIVRPWAFCAGGTDGGFTDGLGQGVYRSKDLQTEVDINGMAGYAYAPLFVIGDQPRYGLPNR